MGLLSKQKQQEVARALTVVESNALEVERIQEQRKVDLAARAKERAERIKAQSKVEAALAKRTEELMGQLVADEGEARRSACEFVARLQLEAEHGLGSPHSPPPRKVALVHLDGERQRLLGG